MSYTVNPITITPAQITHAAQVIINQQTYGHEYTEAQVLAAVENWLRCKVSDILSDADWHFAADRMDIESAAKAKPSFVEESYELVTPAPPEWAAETA